jgi:hypothetical protein
MIAPEASVTVPLMEPRVCCARVDEVSKQRSAKHTRTERDSFFIEKTPLLNLNRHLPGMYHRLATQTECRTVDILDCPGQWAEYEAEVNVGKIGSYNPVNWG